MSDESMRNSISIKELRSLIDEFCRDRSTTIEEARGADAIGEIVHNYLNNQNGASSKDTLDVPHVSASTTKAEGAK